MFAFVHFIRCRPFFCAAEHFTVDIGLATELSRAPCTSMQPALKPLSPQQQRAVRFIARYTEQNSRPHTMLELSAAICKSGKSNPHYLVRPLRDKGYVDQHDGPTPRGLTLTAVAKSWAHADRIAMSTALPPDPGAVLS